jgi:nucleoprotein TPR
MKTRRKSKVQAEAEAEAASQSTEDTSHATLAVALPDDLDLELLAQCAPEVDDWSNLTADTVLKVYSAFLTYAKEHDSIQENLERTTAELEKKDVELDQALQDRESASNEFEVTLETTKVELDKTKQQCEQLGTCISSR